MNDMLDLNDFGLPTWGNLVEAALRSAGADWFGRYPSLSVPEIRESFPELAEMRTVAAFTDSLRICEAFGVPSPRGEIWEAPSLRGSSVPLAGTALGSKVADALSSLELIPTDSADGKELWVFFGTANGPVLVKISAWMVESGRQVIQVSSDLLVCDGPLLDESTLVFMHAMAVTVPAVLQAAFMLAEHPMPKRFDLPTPSLSTILEVEEAELPRPSTIWTMQTPLLLPYWPDQSGVVEGRLSEPFPWVIAGAYEFDAEQKLATCLSLACNAMPKIHSMLCDGLNQGDEQEAAPFDVLIGAGSALSVEPWGFLPVPLIPTP